MDLCYIDEKYMPLAQASLPVTDMIIQRGLGVFETLYCPDKKILALEAHLDRLFDSAAKMGLAVPLSRGQITSIIKEGVRRFDGNPCMARVYITGGDSMAPQDGLFRGRCFFMFLQGHVLPQELYDHRGVGLFLLPQERFFPTVKTVNYSAALRLNAAHPQAMEALYCPDGQITECMSSNFFLWVGDRLVTAPLSRVLAGTSRGIVLTVAREAGYTVEERCPTLAELWKAQEAFLCASSRLVLPVTSIDGKPIGSGCAGPRTVELRQRVMANLSRWLTDVRR